MKNFNGEDETVKKDLLEEIIFSFEKNSTRFTQDSPIYPSVWNAYFFKQEKDKREDLLLVPYRESSSYELMKKLREDLIERNGGIYNKDWSLGNSGDIIVANLTFEELLDVVLPYTRWYRKYLLVPRNSTMDKFEKLVHLVRSSQEEDATLESIRELSYNSDFEELIYPEADDENILCWSINCNRKASVSLNYSISAVKGDASVRLFNINGEKIKWAIMDSGVDATHPAFCKSEFRKKIDDPYEDSPIEYSRVIESYDFTKFRTLFNILELIKSEENIDIESELHPYKEEIDFLIKQATKNGSSFLDKEEYIKNIKYVTESIVNQRALDWSVISQFLRIPHNELYRKPKHSHGTHVAGILGANMGEFEDNEYRNIIGVCPEIQMVDVRVMDENGEGNEFTIISALQFIKWLNRTGDQLYVHGVNMSISLEHDVANYACGRTPICDECQRLVAEGTVVVASAGNQGQSLFLTDKNKKIEGFRTIGITDPGNAQNVITVGATHRNKPHTYGVSYFSSRGPTGDGRIKPDLVAPGEKIKSTLPNAGFGSLDGTSMSAPHVSGAAALLLAKNRELIGNPLKVKKILCESATDLGRDRNFQGYGMLDILRALQKV